MGSPENESHPDNPGPLCGCASRAQTQGKSTCCSPGPQALNDENTPEPVHTAFRDTLPVQPLEFRRATPADNGTIRRLLESWKLPAESVGTKVTDFYVAVHTGAIVGVAGFEYYGEDVLLRSVAVASPFQRHQVGSRMVDWMIALAKQKNKKRIVLLTETASNFFSRKGFEIVDRVSLGNEALMRSSQFSGGCCSSAACMVLDLASIGD